jgi:hypothetical protein
MITYGTAIDKWVGSFSDQTAFYLVIIDSESQMSFCNSSFYSSFQSASASAAPPAGSVHTSASAGRESFSSLVHECDRPQLSSALSTCALRDQAIHTELRLKRGQMTDGREQACRITAFPVRAATSARMIGGSVIPV